LLLAYSTVFIVITNVVFLCVSGRKETSADNKGFHQAGEWRVSHRKLTYSAIRGFCSRQLLYVVHYNSSSRSWKGNAWS